MNDRTNVLEQVDWDTHHNCWSTYLPRDNWWIIFGSPWVIFRSLRVTKNSPTCGNAVALIHFTKPKTIWKFVYLISVLANVDAFKSNNNPKATQITQNGMKHLFETVENRDQNNAIDVTTVLKFDKNSSSSETGRWRFWREATFDEIC